VLENDKKKVLQLERVEQVGGDARANGENSQSERIRVATGKDT
jgi:hypothetical protein